MGFKGFLVSDWAAINQLGPRVQGGYPEVHKCRSGYDYGA